MKDEVTLPFKVGQRAEVKSFEKGFRGAWFKCKIKEISKREGILGNVLEYIDFPDEKLEWTVLYEETFDDEECTKGKHRELMLRPYYPPIYNQKKMPHASKISEVTVIVSDSWRVGDLVDWWTTGCYWSGRITQLLGHNKAQIELKPPPLGEGLSYKVLLKDLRPSLDWSPELGWTVPTQEGRTGSPSVRLVKPVDQGGIAESVELSARSFISSLPSSNPAVSDEEKSRATDTQTRCVGRNRPAKSRPRKTSGEATHSGQSEAGAEAVAAAGEELAGPDYWQKICRGSGGMGLKSERSHTIEAAVMDLEEQLNKVKWLKRILRKGDSSADEEGPQWKFVEATSAVESHK